MDITIRMSKFIIRSQECRQINLNYGFNFGFRRTFLILKMFRTFLLMIRFPSKVNHLEDVRVPESPCTKIINFNIR